jgi:hypothetical protein
MKENMKLCHDTSELEGSAFLSFKTRTYRKSQRNTVTLNTHLDSRFDHFIVINSGIEDQVDLLTKG